MTLAEFQPHVEQALIALEWETARARWRQGLLDERAAIEKHLSLAGQYGIEAAPLEARLAQIDHELAGDVPADHVSQFPLRSVPMDLVATAVARRILRLPAEFPILSIRTLPSDDDIRHALEGIAMRWRTPNGQMPVEQTA